MSLIKYIEQEIHHYYRYQNKFLIALSGGLDSMVLLSLFAKLRHKLPHLRLRAIHIHHGLSPHADHWATHCEKNCRQLGIPFLLEKVTLFNSSNIEAQARQARYQAIAHYRQPDEILITAHHLNDQVETFFLALKRGSGVQGLSSMQRQSEVENIPIFRPLLAIPRQQLEDYAKNIRLVWMEDESNTNEHYDRNFLRNNILPQLNKRWVHFNQSVVRAAQHCTEQQALLNELLQAEFQQYYSESDRTLSIQSFSNFSFAKQKALLRRWFQIQQIQMPSSVQLTQILQDVIQAKADRMPTFQLGNQFLRRYQHRLFITPHFADLSSYLIPCALDETITLPDGLGDIQLRNHQGKILIHWQTTHITLPMPTENLSIRFAYSGKVKLSAAGRNQDIKKVWQSLQVPPWQRSRIPLIFDGERLQSAVGFFTAFQAN